MNNQKPPLTITLPLLLSARGLNETTLASEINKRHEKDVISQTKIWRMRTGESREPRDSSVKPVADYFSLTVEQIKDIDFVKQLTGSGTSGKQMPTTILDLSHTSNFPFIEWDELPRWCGAARTYDPTTYINCSFPAGSSGFITAVTGQSMISDEGYREGEYICVDPDIEAGHGSDVLVLTEGNQVLFRRYQKTSEGVYLQALNSDWPKRLIEMPRGAKVCGVIAGSWMSRIVILG